MGGSPPPGDTGSKEPPPSTLAVLTLSQRDGSLRATWRMITGQGPSPAASLQNHSAVLVTGSACHSLVVGGGRVWVDAGYQPFSCAVFDIDKELWSVPRSASGVMPRMWGAGSAIVRAQ